MRPIAATGMLMLALGGCTHLPRDVKIEAEGHRIEVKKGCLCVTPPPGDENGKPEADGGGDDAA